MAGEGRGRTYFQEKKKSTGMHCVCKTCAKGHEMMHTHTTWMGGRPQMLAELRINGSISNMSLSFVDCSSHPELSGIRLKQKIMYPRQPRPKTYFEVDD